MDGREERKEERGKRKGREEKKRAGNRLEFQSARPFDIRNTSVLSLHFPLESSEWANDDTFISRPLKRR